MAFYADRNHCVPQGDLLINNILEKEKSKAENDWLFIDSTFQLPSGTFNFTIKDFPIVKAELCNLANLIWGKKSLKMKFFLKTLFKFWFFCSFY